MGSPPWGVAGLGHTCDSPGLLRGAYEHTAAAESRSTPRAMFETYFWLCLSAAAAGAINAIAGGGTLLTFPALFAALGTSAGASVMANATSTVALVPASLAAIWGYRRELAPIRRWALWLAGPSLAGGIIGSILVVQRPSHSSWRSPG